MLAEQALVEADIMASASVFVAVPAEALLPSVALVEPLEEFDQPL